MAGLPDRGAPGRRNTTLWAALSGGLCACGARRTGGIGSWSLIEQLLVDAVRGKATLRPGVEAEARTGAAAILVGALYFAGQGGQLVFGDDVPDAIYVALGSAGFVALAVTLWGLRDLIAGTRLGRIGIRVALAGVVVLALFAIQVFVELIRTGDIPENFVLFALGFLLVLVGQLLFARDLRATLGRGWVLPIVAVVGLVMALFLNALGLHDIGLFVFEGAWVGLGVAILRRPAAPRRT